MPPQPVSDLDKGANTKLVIEYDGSGFLGFQRQTRGRTVQGELERVLTRMAGRPVKIIGAGRTDAGVHARGQVANCRLPDSFPVGRIAVALNAGLPDDVRVVTAVRVADEFHARYSARSRTYEYTILNRIDPSAIQARYVWHVPDSLDLPLMREAADALCGRHDFSAFGTPERGRSAWRDLYSLNVDPGGLYVRFECQANAFLSHMARGLVGAIVDAGKGRRSVEDINAALHGERHCSFTIAPPNGLFLTAVEY